MTSKIKQIGSGFNTKLIPYEDLDSLPISICHSRHMPEEPTSFVWQQFSSDPNMDSPSHHARFARHLYKYYPILVDNVLSFLETCIDINIHRSKVSIATNTGCLLPHTDPPFVNTRINIGLLNSSTSTLLIGDNNNKEDFAKSSESFIIEEGNAYLLNTRLVHSVAPSKPKFIGLSRYLITISFQENYAEMLKRVL